jgi:hypothetical protein
MSVWMYAFASEIRRDTGAERSDVACARASLSVQDLLSVGGASGREGLQRTAPRWEKLERPRRAASGLLGVGVCIPSWLSWIVGGGLVHGVASS